MVGHFQKLRTPNRLVSKAAIRSFVGEVAKQFRPDSIILFGSYARGLARPESDVDLLVIMETHKEGEQSLLIRQAVPCDFGVDLIVITPATLQRRLLLGDFFLREAISQGKVLYESANR
ncbi:MAG: nucleotidyltransferase domain-containing protein [Gemmataceae bacterium]